MTTSIANHDTQCTEQADDVHLRCIRCWRRPFHTRKWRSGMCQCKLAHGYELLGHLVANRWKRKTCVDLGIMDFERCIEVHIWRWIWDLPYHVNQKYLLRALVHSSMAAGSRNGHLGSVRRIRDCYFASPVGILKLNKQRTKVLNKRMFERYERFACFKNCRAETTSSLSKAAPVA